MHLVVLDMAVWTSIMDNDCATILFNAPVISIVEGTDPSARLIMILVSRFGFDQL